MLSHTRYSPFGALRRIGYLRVLIARHESSRPRREGARPAVTLKGARMHVEFSYVKVYETEAVCGEHHLGRNSRWRGICGRERTGGSDRRPVERRIPTPPSSLTIRAMSVIVSGRLRHEFLCDRNKYLCRRENRRRVGAGLFPMATQPSTVRLAFAVMAQVRPGGKSGVHESGLWSGSNASPIHNSSQLPAALLRK